MRCSSIIHALTPSLLSLTLLAGRAGAASAGSGDRADALIGAAEQAATTLPDVTVHDSGTWDTVTDCGYRGLCAVLWFCPLLLSRCFWCAAVKCPVRCRRLCGPMPPSGIRSMRWLWLRRQTWLTHRRA